MILFILYYITILNFVLRLMDTMLINDKLDVNPLMNNHAENVIAKINRAKNKTLGEKIDYILKLDTNNELLLTNNLLLGKGAYGMVYYIGTHKILNKDVKCVIKITKSKKEKNEYQNEAYFYNMCNNKNTKFNFLPQFVRTGKAIDFKDNKMQYYDYMILEYVGSKNLDTVLSKMVFSNMYNMSQYLNILYISLFSQLHLIHDSDLSIRDIAFNNVVINDNLLERCNDG
jgi:hypothetical protein